MLTTEDYKRLAECKDTKDVLKALDAIENKIKGNKLWEELKDKDNGSTK